MSSDEASAQRAFLIEIGTEEMPPTALKPLIDAFEAAVLAGLDAASLGYEQAKAFASPRRLALRVDGLDARQADRAIERKGPPVRVAFDSDGQPTKAALKFAEGCGVAVDALERQSTPKGEWLLYRGVEAGQPCEALVPGIVEAALDGLPIPRRMRWGASEAQFVRPVHWVLALLDDAVVPLSILDTPAGNVTYGHRFMAPEAIAIEQPSQYETALEERGRVIADPVRRRALVLEAVTDSATQLGGTAVYDNALLDEVAALVEWPVAVTGRFDERYLALPPEVLIATLQEHQRYFPVRGADGRLVNAFITVSNIVSRAPDAVRTGNERVVRPRLADAEFFVATDRATPLADRVDALGKVVFEKQLGTLLDKTRRVTELAVHLAAEVDADGDAVQRAATLAKADLVTAMVGEFPKLQGTMGRFYAQHDGEPETVSAAIEEQYLPRQAGGALPASTVGQVLSLADRLDTLTGIFGIGKPPTGTRDPFGLRRAALGVLRIAIEASLNVDLQAALALAAKQLPLDVDREALAAEVYDYVMERLRAYYLDDGASGFTAGMVEAVLARRPARPLDFHRRLEAVAEFSGLDEAESLAAANKRIANILRTATDALAAEADASLCQSDAERSLFDAVDERATTVSPLLAAGRYREALVALAALRTPVDAFFDGVMVMDDDARLRVNRLTLLNRMQQLFLQVADLSRLS
ncbi:MAG: glycine--tRNA ligase subunit beta [Pseudomonadota bacterium]